MNTIPKLFATVVEANADRLAVVEGGSSVTYGALGVEIASLARTLEAQGVRRGDSIALLPPNGLDFVTSYFAILMLGAIAVPLNDSYQQQEIRFFLESCTVSVLLTSHEHAELCRSVIASYEAPCRLYLVDDRPAADGSASLADFRVDIDPGAPLMYQFSSGSTGRPKRIARSHRNVLFELDSFIETLAITPDDRFLGVAPFSHVNGLMRSMMASLFAGAALHPIAAFDRRAVAATIAEQQISVFIAVPFMFSALAASTFRQRPDLSLLRPRVSASAPMPKAFNQKFHQNFGMYVRQLYGSTETGTISVNLGPGVADSLASVGTPIRGVEAEVFREDGQPAAVGEMGEFAVRSPAAISRYLGLDDVNREAFRDGSFTTGDLGVKDDQGRLTLKGRKKFFINKGGYKISPYEIEDLLKEHPKVLDVVVAGIPTPCGDERVKAFIVADSAAAEEEFIVFCRGKIADFKVPSVIEFRDSLPKSPTGKIRRNQLT